MNILPKEQRQGWYKWWSVRLAVMAGIVSSSIIAAWPIAAYALDEIIPRGWPRFVLALVTFLIVTGLPIYARLTAQPTGKCDGE
jgi:hypothetical protein